jgi:hypothetical protein
MTIDAPSGVAVAKTNLHEREHSSYVDWPSIIAGVVLASAISLVLISFGSAVGLNFIDLGSGNGPNPIVLGIAAVLWFLAVQILSYMAGGYLTGRLRRRYFDANEHESDFRDGAHGLLVWAGSAILGTMIALNGIGAAANTIGSAAATATTAASNVTEGAADAVDPNAYFVDAMFRTNQPTDAAAARDEAGRIFAQAALGDGTVPEADRTYLANVVAANAGVPPEEAQARVDQAITGINQARDQAADAARTARNAAIIGAFLLAASLLVSAIAAFWAAQKGGNHRDKNTVFTKAFRRF